jgi:hypothetical protein
MHLGIACLLVAFFRLSLELKGLLADALFEILQQLLAECLTILGNVAPIFLLHLSHHVNIPRGCVELIDQLHLLNLKAYLLVVLKCFTQDRV